jgi:hypothetical protein
MVFSVELVMVVYVVEDVYVGAQQIVILLGVLKLNDIWY